MNPKAPFMHHPVMPAAQEDQVVHTGLTAIRPVSDVMRIDKAAADTTRKAASAIAAL